MFFRYGAKIAGAGENYDVIVFVLFMKRISDAKPGKSEFRRNFISKLIPPVRELLRRKSDFVNPLPESKVLIVTL